MNKRIPPYNPMMFSDSGYRTGRIDDSFMPNKPIIQPTDFRNTGQVLHNNLGANLLNEQIIEYNLHIDSINRDLSLYPSQFEFQVTFDGVRQPSIGRIVKNVKYFKLAQVILPNSHKIVSNGGIPPTYIFSTADVDQFIYERILTLKLEEADNGKTLSTDQYFTNGCFSLYQDLTYGEFSVWIARNNIIVFPDSQLFNLRKLSVKLMDYDGSAMVMEGMDSTITSPTDLRNYFCPRTQMTIDITLGVVENYLNTETKYST